MTFEANKQQSQLTIETESSTMSTSKEQYLNILKPYRPLDPSMVKRLYAHAIIEGDEQALRDALTELGEKLPPSAKFERIAEDAELRAEQLDDKYNPEGGGEQPDFTRTDWRTAVQDEHTIIGYWAWVEHQTEQWMDDQEQAEMRKRADVAEWVGLHYKLNFDIMSEVMQADWVKRYEESQEPVIVADEPGSQ